MRKVSEWLQVGYRLIGLIVGLTLFAAAVSSFAEVEAGEDLLTVLTGDVLVASVAIFFAAVAAAIYAKPGFDEAVASRRPAQLEMTYFQLVDSDENPLAAESSDGPPRFRLSQAPPCRVTLYVTVENVGRGASQCILNLRVPFHCGLQPRDPPKAQHDVSSPSGRLVELVRGVSTRCRLSTADAVLPPSVSRTYSAEIDLPNDKVWDAGWPMRVQFFGPNEPGFAVDFAWWVAPFAGAPTVVAHPGS
jgi:hypothetical protein